MSRIKLVVRKGSGNYRAFSFYYGGSMYSAIELRNLARKPKINDVSLKVLGEFYEIFLHPFIYDYHVETKDGVEDIELRFDLDKFCHLLGIESIVKYTIPRSDLYKYKGQEGWENIKNLSIDIPHLKTVNKRRFKNVKAKYVYFYLIPSLIEKPMAVNYNIDKVDAETNIECEMLFYSDVKDDNAIIHLGIEKDDDGFYFPRTFFVEKVSKKEDDIYVKNQEVISVKVKQRLILQGKMKQ